jgi:predicted secreted protein
MKWTSMLAIYVLFWTISAFLVLPFGVKTHEELGLEKVPGQADSAPGNFKPLSVLLYTTLLSAALFGLFYLNFSYGWIDRNSFDFLLGSEI